MALTAVPTDTPQSPSIPVPAALQPALRLLEMAAEGTINGGPSVPSAGALHPYELVVITAGTSEPGVFAVDIPRRTCVLLRHGESVARALNHSRLDLPGPGASLLLTVVRPWLSMRKYGDRGYVYAQLDAAHLGTHLLCLGSRTHRHAKWLTRADAAPLTDLLLLGENCRFLHSVVLLDDPVGGDRAAPEPWQCTDGRTPGTLQHPVEGAECQYWREVAAVRRERGSDSAAARLHSLLPGIGEPLAPIGYPGGPLAWLASRRRSAKDFAPGQLSTRAIRESLAPLATPLMTDLPPTDGFGVTLVVRRVDGLLPGCYPVLSGAIAAPPSRAAVLDDDVLVRICMGQEHLRCACAVVLFHARKRDVFRSGMAGVDQALARAGCLAHLLYLGATGAGAAITAVGGFDGNEWRSRLGIPDEDEVLYVAMLGLPGASSVKLDRLQALYAHGKG
jgi:hypothetical protein